MLTLNVVFSAMTGAVLFISGCVSRPAPPVVDSPWPVPAQCRLPGGESGPAFTAASLEDTTAVRGEPPPRGQLEKLYGTAASEIRSFHGQAYEEANVTLSRDRPIGGEPADWAVWRIFAKGTVADGFGEDEFHLRFHVPDAGPIGILATVPPDLRSITRSDVHSADALVRSDSSANRSLPDPAYLTFVQWAPPWDRCILVWYSSMASEAYACVDCSGVPASVYFFVDLSGRTVLFPSDERASQIPDS